MKFDALGKYLVKLNENEITLTYLHIEKIIGSTLRNSATKYRQYWGNSQANTRAHAWLDNGWIVSKKQMGKSITFTRGKYNERKREVGSNTLSERETIKEIADYLQKKGISLKNDTMERNMKKDQTF